MSLLNSVGALGTFSGNKANNSAPQASAKPTFTPAPSVETAGSVACSAPAPSCSFSAVC